MRNTILGGMDVACLAGFGCRGPGLGSQQTGSQFHVQRTPPPAYTAWPALQLPTETCVQLHPINLPFVGTNLEGLYA